MSEAPSPQRVLAMDVMRGVAVFLMMEQHIGVWLWSSFASPSNFLAHPLFVGFNALGGGAAPLFVCLAGAGSALFDASRRDRWPAARLDATMMRRGLGVMGFGYLLNLLTPSWFSGGSWYLPLILAGVLVLGPVRRRLVADGSRWGAHAPFGVVLLGALALMGAYALSGLGFSGVDPGSWFVLHLMGFAMLLGPLWRRLPTWSLLVLAASVLLASAGLQEWLDTPSHLNNTRMRNTGMVGGALRLAVAEGQFPILPWLALFLEGVVLGRWVAARQWRWVHRLAGGSLILGLAATAAFWLAAPASRQGVAYHLLRFDGIFYPCSPAYILLVGGLVMSVTAGVMAWERRRPFSSDGVMVSLGRASLTLLLLHVWMFRELSRPLGLWSTLEAPAAFGGMLLAIAVYTLFAWQWRRIRFRYGAEWLLRKVAG